METKPSVERAKKIPNIEYLKTPAELLECMLTIRRNRGISLPDAEEEKVATADALKELEETEKQKNRKISFYAIRGEGGEWLQLAF